MTEQATLASHAEDILRTLDIQVRWIEPDARKFLERLKQSPDIRIRSVSRARTALPGELRAAVSVSGESPEVAPAVALRSVVDARERLVTARDRGLLFSAEVATFEALVEVAEAARDYAEAEDESEGAKFARLEEALSKVTLDG